MPFLQIKISFCLVYLEMNSFRSVDAVSKVLSNLEMFQEMGRACLNVVLVLIIGNSRDSIKLGNISK